MELNSSFHFDQVHRHSGSDGSKLPSPAELDRSLTADALLQDLWTSKIDEIVSDIEDMQRMIRTLPELAEHFGLPTETKGRRANPGVFDYLGLAWMTRFEECGELVVINAARRWYSRALVMNPTDHMNKPGRLDSLGSSYRLTFGYSGELADISRAVEYQSQAILLTATDDANKPKWLSNLGKSYARRFEHSGDTTDANRANECFSQAFLLTPDNHENKSSLIQDLGSSRRRLFWHLGGLENIDGAIQSQLQVVLPTPDGHAEKPNMLDSLGSSYLRRFEYFNDPKDVDSAIECQSQAVDRTPSSNAHKPGMLSNLGGSYMRRFERFEKSMDLERAAESLSQAISLTIDGHADKPGRLNNLGCLQAHRFERSSDPTDANKAEECFSQAISLTPDGHVNKIGFFENLGNLFLKQFKYFSKVSDIDKAVSYQSQAVSLTPDGHAQKLDRLISLGDTHLHRFKHLKDDADIHSSMLYYQKAAFYPAGNSLLKIEASRVWAKLSTLYDDASSLSAYQSTMNLIPKVVWIGSAVESRYEYTSLISGLASEAAAAAISENKYSLALEWLEAGRSIVWNQTLQLRNQFDDLLAINPDLAKSLKGAAIVLEQAGTRSSDPTTQLKDAYTLEDAAQAHRRLAVNYETLMSQARLIPGLHDFMKPKKAIELLPAARSGPVIVINVHNSWCDALILRPHTNDITHVSLPDVSLTQLVDLQHRLRDFTSRGTTSRRPEFHVEEPEEPLEIILSALWHMIVKPVLTFLGYVEKLPIDQLPHITWCTTGVLAMLPIHAAGCYDETGDNLFSYAVSSYAPTLSSLLSSGPHSFELGTILAIGQEGTLKETKQELAHVKRHAGTRAYMQLENHEATADIVLDAMEQFNSVHFACHASQNLSRPLKSCFQLHDRGLSLADIAKQSLKNKGLAFLSACQTATGDKGSPDEAIHLAAGMLVAGYPTVVATMWCILDGDAPTIADHVYGQLIKDEKIDNGKVARALHMAVTNLRNQVGERGFVRWVPYIHMGI